MRVRTPILIAPRCLSSDSKSVQLKGKKDSVQQVKHWGSALELPEVTKEQAEEKFLDTTDVRRAIIPPTGLAVQARDDMMADRFNYVSANLNPDSQYVVMGKKGAIAPAQVSQGGFLLGTLCVVMGGITTAVYVKTQWGVSTPLELGDRLREKGAARREAMEVSDHPM